MIMDGRLSSSKSSSTAAAATVTNADTGENSSSTFGHNIPSLQDSADEEQSPTYYYPGDKLIIKAKVYILEILEVS
jgi:hypothetical protein